MSARTRRELEALITAAETRYVDMGVCLRRLTATLSGALPKGTLLTAQGVELQTLESGRAPCLASSIRYASAALPDGAELLDQAGCVVGRLSAEVVLQAGGRWDSVRRCYTGEEPRAPLVYDLMESQVETARWYAAWLKRWTARQQAARHARVRDVRTLLDYGNRGGGKTELGLWLMLAAAVAVPASILWVISASRPRSEEDVHERLVGIIPAAWGGYRGQPAYRWRLLNGSRLREMTGDSPEDLKQGRVDGALLNEGQAMDERAYAYPIGRISDRGGLLVIAANPPTADVPKGGWVLNLFQQVEDLVNEKRWCPVHVIKTDGAKNAAVDQAARDDVALLLRMVSPRIAAADADGAMKSFLPTLIYEFDRQKHGAGGQPDAGDITEQFTRRRYGRAFPFLGVVDFQDNPFIIGSFWKLFGSMEKPILWCVSDLTVKGSEDDFLDEAILTGIPVSEGAAVELEPSTVLWIGDSSAAWQDRKHRGQQALTLPPSFAYFKQRGLAIEAPTWKVLPESKHARNPPLQVSYGHVNRLTKEGRIMVSPLAANVWQAMKECKAKPLLRGGVVAEPRYAHAIDTVRYACWWVDPVTKRQAGGGGERRGVSILPGR